VPTAIRPVVAGRVLRPPTRQPTRVRLGFGPGLQFTGATSPPATPLVTPAACLGRRGGASWVHSDANQGASAACSLTSLEGRSGRALRRSMQPREQTWAALAPPSRVDRGGGERPGWEDQPRRTVTIFADPRPRTTTGCRSTPTSKVGRTRRRYRHADPHPPTCRWQRRGVVRCCLLHRLWHWSRLPASISMAAAGSARLCLAPERPA
jgi:hypothetical protein